MNKDELLFGFVMRQTKTYTKNRLRSGFMVSYVFRIGQRYKEMFLFEKDGVWEPEYVFSIRDIQWVPSISSAKRLIRKLKKKMGTEDVSYPTGSFKHPTFTGSIGGPGFFKLDPEGGPLYAKIEEHAAVGVPAEMLPIRN